MLAGIVQLLELGVFGFAAALLYMAFRLLRTVVVREPPEAEARQTRLLNEMCTEHSHRAEKRE